MIPADDRPSLFYLALMLVAMVAAFLLAKRLLR